jgi:hypothetical protein
MATLQERLVQAVKAEVGTHVLSPPLGILLMV